MRPGETAPVPGNAEVVALLERWLEVAREGEACYVALAMIKSPNLMIVDFIGTIEMDLAIEYALDQVKVKIKEAKKKRELPARDPNLTADYVCYDLANYPVSYDFLPWLIDAEMTRVRHNAPAPLKVAFREGQSYTWGITEYRKVMLEGVVKPLLQLIGAVEDSGALLGRSKDRFTYREVTEAAQAGQSVPTLRASEGASITVEGWLAGKPAPVIITLREAGHWPHRNSNMAAWLRFAADLEKQGERVIFVRDTGKAEEALLNCETCPMASVNIDIRAALYAQAKCNLFVPNGPWNLALFGDKPWLCFNEIDAGDLFLPNHPGWWRNFQGIDDGEQFPWSKPDQRIIWQRDDYENICAAWQQLYPLLAKAA